MKKELEQILFDRYPEFFSERHMPMSQSCMCWGIECGDGWFDLIDKLCLLLTHKISTTGSKYKDFRFQQIKEKYGELRIYHNGGAIVDNLVDYIASISTNICEICGNKGGMYNVNNWFMVRCPKCFSERVSYEDASEDTVVNTTINNIVCE